MAKKDEQKPRRRASRVKEIVKRSGTSLAKKMKERRAKGMAVSLATAAVAGWYEGGKDAEQLALFDVKGKTAEEQNKAITKLDAVGLTAAAIAVWTGNGMAYDVALGLLPCTIRHQMRRMATDRAIASGDLRPPKAVGALEDDDSISGTVSLMGDPMENMAGYDEEVGAMVEVQDY
jgi:hypothetical protein